MVENPQMLESRLPETGTTIFAVMSRLAHDSGAINLSQGFPDFPVAPDLVERVYAAMRAGHNQYAPMAGHPPLLEAIAGKLAGEYRCSVDPAEEVTITAGATEALFAAILVLTQAGDSVILFDPAYDSYEPAVRMAGCVPVRVPLEFPSYSVPWDRVREQINDRTRLLVLNTPHNPTGTILAERDIRELEEIVEQTGVRVLADEVYEHLVFDEERHHSLLSRPALWGRCASVFSFGKTFHATGWKVGYAVAERSLTREIRKAHQFITFAVNTPVQVALAEYLAEPEHYRSLAASFQSRRDLFLERLGDSGWAPLPCAGTYFQLLSYDEQSDEQDTDLALRLIREHGVAAIPISVFYKDPTDHHVLRFCFAKREETLVDAADRLRQVW